MSWQVLLELIRAEVGPELAAQIEARCRRELAGVRITIPASSKPHPTDRDIDRALRQARHNITAAAELLGVAPSTIYRALNRRLARPKPGPAPPLIR